MPKNIFPEYFLIKVEKFEEVIGSDIDEWVYMFKTGVIKDNFKSKGMSSVKEKLNYLGMSQKEQRAYDRYLVDLERQTDILESAEEDGYNKAKKEDKVLLEEYQKREEEAVKREKKILEKLNSSVLKLKNKGFSLSEIAELLGLSESDIK